MSHTPGPWQIVGSHVSTIGNDRERRNVCQTLPDGAFGMGDEQEANARLIAAAPELLEIAQRLSEWELDPDRYAGDLADLAHEAREIIRKAKGE